MAHHDATARGGNGHAKDGMGGGYYKPAQWRWLSTESLSDYDCSGTRLVP